ncbi:MULTISPECIES: prolyl aminopeptidase [Alteromonadaceae]|jgi:proline iminopeptidase|uniref:Proline iminopeptidase n=2 Tax=Alteromonadaceae TaxID=72275 RepID=A0A346NNZ9_9ALTE|nr:prolyl aminopeptidase [Salinimonas sediminis]AXR07256.1 prolyl aminopeptidase [Salinimonas sediminis]
MYPQTDPYDSGYLDVGDGHELYYAQYGNPNGEAAVYVHGGPGGGCSYNEQRYFDPHYFRVILFDQRGAGKSKPYACTDHNSIRHLVNDLEMLRHHLDIARWNLVGGSWGSALSLFYALEHPQFVKRMLLRGIFLADLEGSLHIIEDGGANRYRDDYFAQYRDLVPEDERQQGLVRPYYRLLTQGTEEQALEAATRFHLWDKAIANYNIDQQGLTEIANNREDNLAISRLFFHFVVNEYSADNKIHLLSGQDTLKDIPLDIVHGQEDYICPVANAGA